MNYPKTMQDIKAALESAFAELLQGVGCDAPAGLSWIMKQLKESGQSNEYYLHATARNANQARLQDPWNDLCMSAQFYLGQYIVKSKIGELPGRDSGGTVDSERSGLLNQIQISMDEIGAKEQPNLATQVNYRGAQDKQHIANFLEQIKTDFWGGEWLTDNQYHDFMQSPAVCLFSRQDFDNWNLPLHAHISEVRPYHRDAIAINQRGVEVLEEPFIKDGHEYWTRFLMRLSIWKQHSQPPLPSNEKGELIANLAEVLDWVERLKEPGTLRQVETIRDLRDAKCMELTASQKNFTGPPLYEPDYWKLMAPGDGAWIKPEVILNPIKIRQEYRVEWAYPGTVLFEFADNVRALAYEMDWPEEVATRALATGELPARSAIVISPRFLPGTNPAQIDRLQLSIDPAASPKMVQEVYKAAMRALGVKGQIHGELNTRVLEHVKAEMRKRGLKDNPTDDQIYDFYETFQWPEDRNYKRKDKWVFKQAYDRAINQNRLNP